MSSTCTFIDTWLVLVFQQENDSDDDDEDQEDDGEDEEKWMSLCKVVYNKSGSFQL